MQRRTFIKSSSLTVFSVSVFGSLNWNGKSFEGDTPTTTDILGPFYRPGAPIRTNLVLPNSKGTPVILRGRVFKEDGKTPVPNAFVEIWHCDENEVYDNASDDYRYRGGQKTRTDGKYQFTSILPVPYKANPNDESSWRPAHIHMRVSVPGQQDLITQLYFKGGKYISSDKWASAPQAVNRILDISENNSGVRQVIFDITMSKEIPLDPQVYEKLAGLYKFEDNTLVEFTQNDDLLFMKRNGQLTAGLKYIGNNSFEGGIGFPKVSFELHAGGDVKVSVVTANSTFTGIKFLKYKPS